MKFRPLHDRVLIKVLDSEEKTAGGIIIPDTAKEKPQEGEVVAVGPGAKNDDGKLSAMDVKVGDIVLFRNNFYEIDTRVENQLILGRDKDYAISTETTDFGESFSIIVSGHISRVEKLNLIPLREGKYPTTEKLDGGEANRILDNGIGFMSITSTFIVS